MTLGGDGGLRGGGKLGGGGMECGGGGIKYGKYWAFWIWAMMIYE